jgi:hypothetical protein
LVTRRSAERECIRDGKPTKEVVLKIIDNRLVVCAIVENSSLIRVILNYFLTHFCIAHSISGECECALFGSYVDEFQSLIDRSGGGLPVVVIQFAKIKLVQG